MSGRQKKVIRNRVAARVLNGDITVHEGLRALNAAGVPYKGRKARQAAAKSAAPPQRATPGADVIYKSRQALTPLQRSYLEIYDTHSDPVVRERAWKAAFPEEKTP